MEKLKIHKTAIIDPKAQIGAGVEIGPYSVIGPEVVLKDQTHVASHCVIEGKTVIGKNCQIFSGAVVGGMPQDKKFTGENGVTLTLGDHNVVREFVTIHRGTREGGGKTVIGQNNLFMAYSHIAHDCVVGNNCVIANSGTLAGHVTLEDNVIVGGLTAIHQFVRLGRLSIVGGCSKVVQDVPPFSLCDGHPVKVYGLNLVGLRRNHVCAESIRLLKQAFRILFSSGLTKAHAIEQIEKDIKASSEIEHLIFFTKTTKRGLCS